MTPFMVLIERVRFVRGNGEGVFGKLFIEGLAIEQTGQRIAFAVVEQTLIIAVDAENASMTSRAPASNGP